MTLFSSEQIPGYARFRIPGIIACSGGTLLAYCEARKSDSDWAQIDILLRRSTDGGRSFSAHAVLVAGTKMKKTVNNPVMIAGHNGTVHFLFCVEYGLPESGGGVYYRRSEDAGVTWSEPRDITAMTSPELRNAFATGPGHGIALSDGRLFVPCWTVLKSQGAEPRSHHPGTVCALTSMDHGAEWRIGAWIPNGTVRDPNETAAAQLNDGRIVLSVRDGNTRSRCFSCSADGEDFSPIVPLSDVPDPICCAGMVAAGDILYLTGCGSRTDRIDLTLRKSRDGAAWDSVAKVVPGPAGYSDLAYDNGKLFILYEKETAIGMTTVSVNCGD